MKNEHNANNKNLTDQTKRAIHSKLIQFPCCSEISVVTLSKWSAIFLSDCISSSICSFFSLSLLRFLLCAHIAKNPNKMIKTATEITTMLTALVGCNGCVVGYGVGSIVGSIVG